MIKSANKVNIPSIDGGEDLKIEFNYNKQAKEDRILKVTLGDTKTYVKFEDLYGLIFVIANQNEQDNIMPVRQTQITKFVKQHTIRCKKNMKRGEDIIVNCSIDVPTTVTEGLRGLLQNKKKKSLIIH